MIDQIRNAQIIRNDEQKNPLLEEQRIEFYRIIRCDLRQKLKSIARRER